MATTALTITALASTALASTYATRPAAETACPAAEILPAFLSSAPLEETEETGGLGGLLGSSMFPLLLIGVIFWFVILGPERKNRKKRELMIAALKKGDEVITNSGLYGTIVQFKGDQVVLQVDERVRLRFARVAIQGLANAEQAAQRAQPAPEPSDGESAAGQASKPS